MSESPEEQALRELREQSFGRLTPEAAYNNVVSWLQEEKNKESRAIAQATRRVEMLKIPVPIDLAEIGTLEISRLVFEEIEARMACHISYDDECENMTADVLIVLLRHGVIKLGERT